MNTQLPSPSPLSGLLGPCLRSAVFVALTTGLAYPLLTTAVAQLLLPAQASGSLVIRHGAVVGSHLIGQNFTQAQYFHPRPSSTADSPYNAAASSGSNQGPTNTDLIGTVVQRVTSYRTNNGLADNTPVPIDAVTASASGLDPDISLANAQLQALRVAQVRGLNSSTMQTHINQCTKGRWLGLIGEPRVQVLCLNLALDAMTPRASGVSYDE